MIFRKLLACAVVLPAVAAAGGRGNPVPDGEPLPFIDVEQGKRYLAEKFEPRRAAEGVTIYFDDAKIHTWHLFEALDGESRAIIRSRVGWSDGRIADLYRIQCEGVQSWCEHLVKWQEAELRDHPPPPPPPELMDLI